jgi:hypothetical protein
MDNTKRFLTWPPTIVLYAVLLGLLTAYAIWFQPSWPFALAAILLALGLGIGWIPFGTRSKAFQDKLLGKAPGPAGLQASLRGATPAFARAALECESLIAGISRDFKESAFGPDLAALLERMPELARENARLSALFRSYGSGDQRERMAAILKRQEDAMRSQAEGLRSFAGKLALMEAGRPAADGGMGLGDLNRAVDELLKEAGNERAT